MVATVTTREKPVYYVCCIKCGNAWQPSIGSAMWWKAHQRAQKGFLDAYHANAKECGCAPERPCSNAPFRVFGYTSDCYDFDVPCYTFVEAIKAFRSYLQGMNVVFIEGVSDAVRQRIEFGY